MQLLCSMSGAGTRSVWEDVTATTPLATTATTATFSSLVSAQFWLLRLPAWMAVDKIPIADNIFRWTGILLLSRVQSQIGFYQRSQATAINLNASGGIVNISLITIFLTGFIIPIHQFD